MQNREPKTDAHLRPEDGSLASRVARTTLLCALLVTILGHAAAQVTERGLLVGRSERLTFETPVRRVSVADPDVLRSDVLDDREVLLSGIAPGVTSLTIWFATGDPLQQLVTVGRDLSLLRELLASIDPAIELEFAADRDFVVLTGTVETLTLRETAQTAVEAFLGARTPTPLLGEGSEGSGPTAITEAPIDLERPSQGAVVNLLQVRTLPAPLEARILGALDGFTDSAIDVRRIQSGLQPDDEQDVFHLSGTVPDQVTLTRALYLASRTIGGAGGSGRGSNEVRALTDEAGALTQARNILGAGSVGGGGGQQQGLRTTGNKALGGGGSGQTQQQVANRIGSQVGRAKVVEAAGGRILSTIQVEHLPLVRVDVRLYEVDSSRLRAWRSQLGLAVASFDQPSLLPSQISRDLQGGSAPSVGDGDVQGLLGFLNGTLSGGGQAVSGGLAVDSLFQLLVEAEVARSISNPSLAVLSGEVAQFQVGGQIPVPIARTIGGGTDQVLNSIEFRNYGIDLLVRPLVEERSSSRITLDVTPRISNPDLALTAAIGSATGQSSGATAFESRATRTSARVFDGDALVIGGLSSARSQSAEARTPVLGSLPVLQWLFRNDAADSEERELVIVVRPSVVREPRPNAELWAFPTTNEVLTRCLEAVRSPDAPTTRPRSR